METAYTKYGATINNDNLVIVWKNQIFKQRKIKLVF